MNTTVMVMHALKETCALHCLVALHLAGPGPVTQQTVMALTGFEDSAVHRGLHKLRALGLATCTGQRHHTGWQLAPAAAELKLGLPPPLPPQAVPPARPPLPAPPDSAPAEPVPTAPAASAPGPSAAAPAQRESETPTPQRAIPARRESIASAVSTPIPARQESTSPAAQQNPIRRESIASAVSTPIPARQESTSPAAQQNPIRRESIASAASTPIPARQESTSPAARHPIPARRESISAASTPNPVQRESAPERESGESLILKDQKLHQSQLHQIFHHAKIWPGGRAQLARALAQEGGPHWVGQALGWLCYAVQCLPAMNTGAVLFSALRDRLEIAPEFLPPPDLPFAAALAWAARGGEEALGYANEPGEAGDSGEGHKGYKGYEGRGDAGETGDAREGHKGSEGHEGNEGRGDSGDSRDPGDANVAAGRAAGPAEGAASGPAAGVGPWAAVLARLRAESPGGQVHPWVAGAKLAAAGPGAWRLVVKDRQARDWINNRLRERLANLLGEVLGEGVGLEVVQH